MRRGRRALVGAACLVTTCVAGWIVVGERRPDGEPPERAAAVESETGERPAVAFPPQPMEEPEYRYRPGDIEPVIVFFRPGIREPQAVPAEQADLPDDTQVIGVVVDGHARAYVASAMSEPETHVINDRIGGKYVSVAFCDIQQCATAYRADADGERPLELWVAGWDYDEMVLLGPKGSFRQKSDPPRYPTVPCELTTWGRWRRRHPRTDVVVRVADRRRKAGHGRPQASDRAGSHP
ncbi:MAG: DUF3179 domain-containing protein [Planctomycetota bacterium]|nr:MAG: DUF3179 domain-containing protein [Planctomycetota bacterium]